MENQNKILLNIIVFCLTIKKQSSKPVHHFSKLKRTMQMLEKIKGFVHHTLETDRSCGRFLNPENLVPEWPEAIKE